MEEMGRKAVYTICNHNYCSTCIIKFVRTNQGRQIVCPYCRRLLSLLVIADENGVEKDELDYIKNYNASFSDERDLIDCLISIPSVIKAFFSEVIRTKGMILLSNW